MFDLVIRGGTVVDGTGAPGHRGDVGVRDGVIAAVGDLAEAEAAESVAADGALVTPGFVDVHTHYDGQVTWDEVLEPSTPHGVTTVVMGNCGVGFAPVRPGREDWLIQLMEGVEDIPGAALAEGISWGWESFPEYLDVLGQRRWSIDVATQLPHGALRGYVMGDRGAANEPATADDIAEMARLAREAVEAGALGFTTSRTLGHLSKEGVPVPGTFAADDELFAIGSAIADGGARIFEVAGAGISRHDDPGIVATELDWMGRLAELTDLTTTFIVLQHDDDRTRWRAEMDRAAEHRRRGHRVVPLVAGRPFGVLFGWDVRHPFAHRPSYRAVAHLPLAERVAELARPEVRRAILSEDDLPPQGMEALFHEFIVDTIGEAFVLGDPPDYEPGPERRLDSIARERGVSLLEAAYDALLADGGRSMLLRAVFNYSDGDHAALHEQLQDPDAILGLDDGGAHCGTICDASIPTYALTHWARDRTRGPRLSVEDVVRRLTSQPAELYGFGDRGVIAEGKRADLNVVDHQALRLDTPTAVHDLPAGGVRLLQGATGYRATVVAGEVTRRDGVDTGARPGRLIRG
ncbi:MAG: amidohydrolase family protein [Actinomycetota bacterium]